MRKAVGSQLDNRPSQARSVPSKPSRLRKQQSVGHNNDARNEVPDSLSSSNGMLTRSVGKKEPSRSEQASTKHDAIEQQSRPSLQEKTQLHHRIKDLEDTVNHLDKTLDQKEVEQCNTPDQNLHACDSVPEYMKSLELDKAAHLLHITMLNQQHAEEQQAIHDHHHVIKDILASVEHAEEIHQQTFIQKLERQNECLLHHIQTLEQEHVEERQEIEEHYRQQVRNHMEDQLHQVRKVEIAHAEECRAIEDHNQSIKGLLADAEHEVKVHEQSCIQNVEHQNEGHLLQILRLEQEHVEERQAIKDTLHQQARLQNETNLLNICKLEHEHAEGLQAVEEHHESITGLLHDRIAGLQQKIDEEQNRIDSLLQNQIVEERVEQANHEEVEHQHSRIKSLEQENIYHLLELRKLTHEEAEKRQAIDEHHRSVNGSLLDKKFQLQQLTTEQQQRIDELLHNQTINGFLHDRHAALEQEVSEHQFRIDDLLSHQLCHEQIRQAELEEIVHQQSRIESLEQEKEVQWLQSHKLQEQHAVERQAIEDHHQSVQGHLHDRLAALQQIIDEQQHRIDGYLGELICKTEMEDATHDEHVHQQSCMKRLQEERVEQCFQIRKLEQEHAEERQAIEKQHLSVRGLLVSAVQEEDWHRQARIKKLERQKLADSIQLRKLAEEHAEEQHAMEKHHYQKNADQLLQMRKLEQDHAVERQELENHYQSIERHMHDRYVELQLIIDEQQHRIDGYSGELFCRMGIEQAEHDENVYRQSCMKILEQDQVDQLLQIRKLEQDCWQSCSKILKQGKVDQLLQIRKLEHEQAEERRAIQEYHQSTRGLLLNRHAALEQDSAQQRSLVKNLEQEKEDQLLQIRNMEQEHAEERQSIEEYLQSTNKLKLNGYAALEQENMYQQSQINNLEEEKEDQLRRIIWLQQQQAQQKEHAKRQQQSRSSGTIAQAYPASVKKAVGAPKLGYEEKLSAVSPSGRPRNLSLHKKLSSRTGDPRSPSSLASPFSQAAGYLKSGDRESAFRFGE